jgi:hypothetical protein
VLRGRHCHRRDPSGSRCQSPDRAAVAMLTEKAMGAAVPVDAVVGEHGPVPSPSGVGADLWAGSTGGGNTRESSGGPAPKWATSSGPRRSIALRSPRARRTTRSSAVSRCGLSPRKTSPVRTVLPVAVGQPPRSLTLHAPSSDSCRRREPPCEAADTGAGPSGATSSAAMGLGIGARAHARECDSGS